MENKIEFKLSEETQAQLVKSMCEIGKSLNDLYDVLTEIVEKIIEAARLVAEQLGRFFLKQQLLEWRIPLRMADFISQKIYWYWAVKFGFYWFERKMLLIE